MTYGEWQAVVYAHDCFPCDCCEEPVCPKCEVHYADCDCPGPHQEDEFDYDEDGDSARRILDG